jgi:hypothetical protein
LTQLEGVFEKIKQDILTFITVPFLNVEVSTINSGSFMPLNLKNTSAPQ